MRQPLLKQQPILRLSGTQGTGRTHTVPSTLTKIILVLLTMLFLPSAAWANYYYGSNGTDPYTLTYNKDIHQYSSTDGSVWNVTLTGSSPHFNDQNSTFSQFEELRLTSTEPYKGTMSGFTFSGGEGIFGGTYGSTYIKYADKILVYKSSAPDFSDRTEIGEVTGDSYTYNSTSSQVLDNEYLQVVILRTSSEAATYEFPSNKINGIAMTFDGTSYGIKVGNRRVTSNNSTDILGDGKVSYNSADYTLTLNGATIEGCIRYSGTNGLNIQFEGNNIITAVDSAAIRTVYLSSATPSQLPSLTLSGSGNAKLSSNGYAGYSAIAGFSQINGGLSAAYLEDYIGAEFTSLTGGKDIIICNGSPYGFYVGGTIVTASNKATVLGSGVDFIPATTDVATLTFSDNATIPGELEWDLNNALKIQLSGANTVQGCIHSNKAVALSVTYPSGATNSSLTFGNSEGTQSAISGFTEVTFPYINSPGDNKLSFDENVSYNTSDKALKNDKNEVVTSSHISYHYGLTIAGVAVTSANYEDILDGENAGKVSFTPDNNILTLKSANITVNGKNAIESGLANLTVNLINLDGVESVITCQGNTDRVFKGIQSGAKVTFTTDATNPGSLGVFVNQESYMFDGIDPIYQNGLNYWRKGYSFSIDTKCGIKIGDVEISSANIGSGGTITGVAGIKSGTVKFTPADNTTTPATPATLTLTNATLGKSTAGCSIESILDNLTINLEGTNTLYGHMAYSETGATAGSLAFTGDGSLTLSYSDGVISDFSAVDFGDFNFASISQGINYNTSTKNLEDANEGTVSNVTIIKGTYYPIWVKGTLVTESNCSDVLKDGKVSFDPTGNKLSLDEATIDCSETSGVVPVASTIKDLKVYLSGINTIKVYPYSNEAFVYAGSESGATLTFSTVDPSDYENLGMLTIDGIGSKDDISSGYAVKGLVGETSTSIGDWGNDNYNKTDRSVSGWKLEESNGGDKYVKLSYREVYDLWISSVRYCSDNLSNNEGEAFDPKTSTLTLTGLSDSYYNRIYSGLPALTINIGGENVLEAISFGSPDPTGEPISATSGTLTITKDSESSSSSNSLTLSNSDGGVITGFSSENITITLPMHVLYTNLDEFTGWTSDVTYAYITDEPDDDIFYDKFRDGINYVTFYSERDLYLSDAYTPAVITEISGSTVKTQALSYIPKKTPVLVSKAKNTATTATFSKNELKFAESGKPVFATEGKALYVLYKDQFVKLTQGSEIDYKGYLDLTGVNLPANTRGLSIDGNAGTSAIDATIFEELSTEGDVWYDLQGRRIAKPTKAGLYIINGKKVVLK